MLQHFALDYKKISAGWADEEAIGRFFAPAAFQARRLENRQVFGFAGLRGRLLSSSYAPPAGHPRHEPMIAELRRVFDLHQRDGEVAFEYDTNVYWGRLT